MGSEFLFGHVPVVVFLEIYWQRMKSTPETVSSIVTWTKLKCRIEADPSNEVHAKEREIWWASIGMNLGSEQNGKNERFDRPVLVIRKFTANTMLVVPMTSVDKVGSYYVTVSSDGHTTSTAILSQLRTISSKRLIKKQRMLSEPEFEEIRKRIRALI